MGARGTYRTLPCPNPTASNRCCQRSNASSPWQQYPVPQMGRRDEARILATIKARKNTVLLEACSQGVGCGRTIFGEGRWDRQVLCRRWKWYYIESKPSSPQSKGGEEEKTNRIIKVVSVTPTHLIWCSHVTNRCVRWSEYFSPSQSYEAYYLSHQPYCSYNKII